MASRARACSRPQPRRHRLRGDFPGGSREWRPNSGATTARHPPFPEKGDAFTYFLPPTTAQQVRPFGLHIRANWPECRYMQEPAPLFGISEFAAGRTVDRFGLLLALRPRRRFREDAVLIADGIPVSTRDHTVAEQSRHLVTVGRPLPGNRNDCQAWELSGAKAAVGHTTVIADGGYRGTVLVIPHRALCWSSRTVATPARANSPATRARTVRCERLCSSPQAQPRAEGPPLRSQATALRVSHGSGIPQPSPAVSPRRHHAHNRSDFVDQAGGPRQPAMSIWVRFSLPGS
ncbi:hypothetical protein GCM10010365_58490 [Streptomyces poonensis]|uniref:Transposase n=1 Tax=Streptomyces poonensis TaxID=68255 RepID=A0A918Q1G1_9ACTN|nr:hypothetical protein GCM10010365_58490 [Streptomyces poonensis]